MVTIRTAQYSNILPSKTAHTGAAYKWTQLHVSTNPWPTQHVTSLQADGSITLRPT